MNKHIRISYPLIGAALIILLISILRFLMVGSIGLEQGTPNPTQSNILFVLFLVSIALTLVGYYQALLKSEALEYNIKEIKFLSFILVFISIFTLPLLSSDIFIYMVCGDVANISGINPYTDFKFFDQSQYYQFVSPTWKGKAINVYGPVNLFIMQLSALIGNGSIWISILVYKIFAAFSAVLFIEIAFRIITKKKLEKSKQIFAFIALSPIIWLQCVSQVHNDIFVALFIILGIFYLEKENYLLTMLFFSIAVSTKLYAVLLIPILVLYFILKYKITLKTLKYTLLFLVILIITSIATYLPYWDGFETLSVYTKEFNAKLLNNPAHILGLVITKLFSISKLNEDIVYSFTRYLFVIPAVLLGIYLLIKLIKGQESFYNFIVKGLILFFCFYIARYHQWYFIVVLPFTLFDIHKSWLIWGVLVFSISSFFDIHNFMDKKAITIYSIPVAVLFVNILFFWKIKDRFLTFEKN